MSYSSSFYIVDMHSLIYAMQIFSFILGFTHLKLPFNEVKFMILNKFNFTFYLRFMKSLPPTKH